MWPHRTVLVVGAALAGVALTACQWLVGIGALDETSPVAAAPSAIADGGAAAEPFISDADTEADAAPSCRLGFAVCAGTCVAIGNDPKHCGGCGHDCLGAECLAGECAPELVAPDSKGGAVYVRGEEIFYRVDEDLVTSRLVARNLTTRAVRDVCDLGSYFTMHPLPGTEWLVTDNTLGSSPARARVRVVDGATGVTVRTLYSGPVNPNVRTAVAQGDDVYIATRSDVRHVKLTGGPVSVIRAILATEGVGATQAIHASAAAVYFGIEDTNGLHELARTAGATSRRVDEAPRQKSASAGYIDTRPGFVRWLIGDELRDTPLDGGVPAVYTLPLVTPHGPIGRGTKLFVADDQFGDSKTSRVLRIDLETREVLVLASRQDPYGQLAVDDRYVYMPRYANFGGGVFRVAR